MVFDATFIWYSNCYTMFIVRFIPAPYQVRYKLQQETIDFRLLWTPAPRSVSRAGLAGVTGF